MQKLVYLFILDCIYMKVVKVHVNCNKKLSLVNINPIYHCKY